MQISFTDFLEKNGGLLPAETAVLDNSLSRHTVEKGGFLLREGAVSRHFYFVEKGLLRFYSIDKAGKEHIVQFAPEGWFTGDRGSIYFQEGSEYFIDAIEESTVVFLSTEIMQQAAAKSDDFRRYNERLLQNHIHHLQKRIRLLISASAEERYLDFTAVYPDLLQRVPQWMIASYLGITPESLSRVRKALAKKDGSD